MDEPVKQDVFKQKRSKYKLLLFCLIIELNQSAKTIILLLFNSIVPELIGNQYV